MLSRMGWHVTSISLVEPYVKVWKIHPLYKFKPFIAELKAVFSDGMRFKPCFRWFQSWLYFSLSGHLHRRSRHLRRRWCSRRLRGFQASCSWRRPSGRRGSGWYNFKSGTRGLDGLSWLSGAFGYDTSFVTRINRVHIAPSFPFTRVYIWNKSNMISLYRL